MYINHEISQSFLFSATYSTNTGVQFVNHEIMIIVFPCNHACNCACETNIAPMHTLDFIVSAVAILSSGNYGAEFVVSFSSRCQVVNFFMWKHHYLSENIGIFHSNDDLFTPYLFLNKKRCHLMTFSWRLESERTRAREKRNHKFLPFMVCITSYAH